MSNKNKTRVAKHLKKERIWINSNGQEVDRVSQGKKNLNGDLSKQDEIENLEARLKELKGDE